MHDRSRTVHGAAIIIDALQISNWGEAVFRNMRHGGQALNLNPKESQR